MKALLLLFLPMTAFAQVYDYSGTLTGTETIWNYSDGPPTTTVDIVDATLTGIVDVFATQPETFDFTASGIGTFEGPTPGNGGATGEAINWTSPDTPGGGETLSVSGSSAYVSLSYGCESTLCTVFDLSGTGTWSSPSAAPEIDPSGAIGALTLLAGLVLLARSRRA